VEDLHSTLERLRDAARGQEIQNALDQVVRSSTTAFGVAGCGVMFADGEHVLHYAAASDEEGRKLEEAQSAAARGPCVDALVHDTVVTTRDVTADERWPAPPSARSTPTATTPTNGPTRRAPAWPPTGS
jgi:hypothetical protein